MSSAGSCPDYLPRAKLKVDPDDALETWGSEIIADPVPRLNPFGPKLAGHTRFVCLSDTHGCHRRVEVPPGDVLLHAGDFTRTGTPREVMDFVEFLSSLPHRHKIVIAGNHDLTMDPQSYKQLWRVHRHPKEQDCVALKALLKEHCTYLEDELVMVEGFSVYGSPWQPTFGQWAFNLDRGSPCQSKWDLIPEGVDVLLTHTPPLAHGDLCFHGHRAGCVNLLDTVEFKVRPKVHVFGHIHEGYGITTNGRTLFVNCSTCDERYRPLNAPIVFDLPNRVSRAEPCPPGESCGKGLEPVGPLPNSPAKTMLGPSVAKHTFQGEPSCSFAPKKRRGPVD